MSPPSLPWAWWPRPWRRWCWRARRCGSSAATPSTSSSATIAPTSTHLPERVLLIGMMGAGKTTVGRALAERLGWPYLDSDEQVERNTGRTVPEIFEADGEAAFRAEEKRALAEATTSTGPVVVSVAGGAVLDPENRRRLREGGRVVWLRASVSTLAARVGS